jgi:hypothetical protein
VRDSIVDGLAITRASGKVYAETERLFRIEIPLEYTAKRVVSSRNVEKYIIFFGKEIKVFKNGRNNTQSCDTINRVEYFSLFGDIRLPIGIRSTEETVYETEKLRYSEKEAMNLAYYKLSQRIDEELSDAQILKKSVSTYIDNDQYILECRMKCIENIGLIYEFDFEEIGQ